MSPLERLGLEVVAYTLLGRRMEASILLVLMDANGGIVSHETLAKARRWKMMDHPELNRKAVAVRICMLRDCLEDIGFPGVIKTEDGLGYSLPKAAKKRLLERMMEEVSA